MQILLIYQNHFYFLISITVIILYIIYYFKFRRYKVTFKTKSISNKNIGNPIPSFPNGWYIVARSQEIAINQTKSKDISGQNIALFRGSNNIVYALQSYCAHMGANLAIGGKIVNETCIQCPFHGWLYDGQSGYCVEGKNKKLKEIHSYQYPINFGSKQCKQVVWNVNKENVKLRKYSVKQIDGYIYIWIHSDSQQNFTFQPFEIKNQIQGLDYRGYSINIIKCHVQDIPENGSDMMHFFYVHQYAIQNFSLIKFKWKGNYLLEANWTRANDPQLLQNSKHQKKWIQEEKLRLIKKYVTKQNQNYIGILNLDCFIKLPFLKQFFIFNVTAFQVGPGLVYLFLNSILFRLIFLQHIQTIQKYYHKLYHQIYVSNWLPYFFSSIFLRGQAAQVYNDSKIWDNKKFGRKGFYNIQNQADKKLIKWRQWYSQFYQGCLQKQKKNIDW